MPLAPILATVNDVVRAQAAPGPAPAAARAFGPHLLAGRGSGIRTLEDYLSALALVEQQINNQEELIGRLRLASRPALFADLFRARAEWLTTPPWYWAGGVGNDEASQAWDTVATCGYIDVGWQPGQPRELTAVWPVWLALDSLSGNSFQTTLAAQKDDPPELRSPADYVTWAGGLARAWTEWNQWRRVSHSGRPVDEWEDAESTPLDQAQLRRAMARLVPLEDVRGFLDAMVLAAMAQAAPDRSVTALLSDYYSSTFPSPVPQHVSERLAWFLTSSSFQRLAAAGKTDEASLRTLARAVAPAALRRLSRSRREREDEAGTPWGQAALELLADQFAAVLAAAAGPLGGWPTGGFGARSVGTRGTIAPLYGGWDLQFGDDDAALRYAGLARTATGGHITALVADLRTLGFTAPDENTTTFDARVAMAVREFQIEASQAKICVPREGRRVATPAVRQYLGRCHGIVDAETRRLLQLWLDLPRVDGDPAEHAQANVSRARNGLLVVACGSTPQTVPVASQVVKVDLWGPCGTPKADGVDTFDYKVTDRRHWAVDRLQRWETPRAAEMPNLFDFSEGIVVPLQDVDVVPIGRHNTHIIHGPWLISSDTWRSTQLTLDRFRQHPRAGVPVREEDWRIVCGMTQPETSGFADIMNGYDHALFSFGWCHWTLRAAVQGKEAGPGELGALLAWYRQRDPEAFNADFGRWGVAAPMWPTKREAPGKYIASVLFYGLPANGFAVPHRAAAPGDGHYLNHTWMRSWRVFYRIAQSVRRSAGMHAAMREFAVRRIWELLHHTWSWAGVALFTTPATLGQLFTSQKAIVALLRWHINQPGDLFGDRAPFTAQKRLADAVRTAAAEYRRVAGLGPNILIDAATLDDPNAAGAVAFQNQLLTSLTINEPESVRAGDAVAAKLPDGTSLSGAPGTYPGPVPTGDYP